MKWTMVRPNVLRITYDNGAFYCEYDVKSRVQLTKNRGNAERLDLAQVEREAQTLAGTVDTTANAGR
jgi:hypothetical protein